MSEFKIFDTALEAKVAAVNLCHTTANEVYDRLKTFFSQFVGKKIFTNDGLAANVKKLYVELNLPDNNTVYVRIQHDEYSLYFRVHGCYSYKARDYSEEHRYCTPMGHTVLVYIGHLEDGKILKDVDYAPDNYKMDYTVQDVIRLRETNTRAKALASAAASALEPFGEYDR